MRTGLKSDFFSFKFFKIVRFFGHFCSCAFLSISTNLEFIPINFEVRDVKGSLSVGLIPTVLGGGWGPP